ncbi:MAG: DUF4190 domain-containing protein [Tepidisphaeraceae bacterium]|jgi:hypothetical protein
MEPWQIGQRFPCAKCNQEFVAANPVYATTVLPMARPQQQPNGMAVASLVCGLILCLPIASLMAVIFGVIALNKTKDPQVGGKGMAIAGTALGGVGILLVPLMFLTIMLPAINAGRDAANRVQSAQHIQQISQAIIAYANNNNGDYPPDLGSLYRDQSLDLKLFVCPGTGTTPPINMTIDQAVQWVNLNSDYVYMGAGMKSPASPNALVIYEKDSDHDNRGDNVLYGDGRVVYLPVPAVHQAIAVTNYYGTSQQ